MGTWTPAASTAKIVVMTSSMSKKAATVFARGFESFQCFFVALYSEPAKKSNVAALLAHGYIMTSTPSTRRLLDSTRTEQRPICVL